MKTIIFKYYIMSGIGKIKLSNKFKDKLEGMLGGKIGKKTIPPPPRPALTVKKKKPLVVGDNETKIEHMVEKHEITKKTDESIVEKHSLREGEKRILNIQNIIKFPRKTKEKNSNSVKYFLLGVSCTLNIVLLIQCFLT
jgi:hypothetical protein